MRRCTIGSVVLISALASVAEANPAVSSVSGTIGGNQQITITGTGFGGGPNVVLFDDFGAGTAGQKHPGAAVIGAWSTASGIVFADPKLSNGKGIRVVGSPGQLTSTVVFPTPASEVYTSFVGYVPDGYKFPLATEEEQMQAAIKVMWMMNGGDGYNKPEKSDYWTAAAKYRVASNDSNGPSTFDTSGDAGWAWDVPVRWGFWAKGNGTERIGSDGMFQATNGQEQVYTRYKDYKPWFTDAHAQHQWDRINVVGYVVSGASFDEGHNFVMDDIYVATGPNAAARVEIGNAATYGACTMLTLVTTGAPGDVWTSTSITATIREGGFTLDQLRNGYLYITAGDGTVNRVGFQLSSIPEPSTVGVLSLGALTLRRRR